MRHSRDSTEAYRGVNKYMDYTTGEEHLVYTEKVYYLPNGATAARRRRLKDHRGNPTLTIRTPAGMRGTKFEFVEGWTERAKEWERV